MRRFYWFLILIGTFTQHAVATQNKEVIYGKIPDWTLPPPTPTATITPADAAFRILYSDVQVGVTDENAQTFISYRAKILKPDALNMGNVNVSWNPGTGNVTVHHLRLIRNSETIDILKQKKFEVVRREGELEYAVLNGILTATLQIPGVQVGDEIEFAGTTSFRDPTLGNHVFGATQLTPVGALGAYRMRVTWPGGRAMQWQVSKDIGSTVPVLVNGKKDLVLELRDPKSSVMTEGAPLRFNFRRVFEFSDFTSWREMSQLVSTVFEKTTSLKPNSAIRGEIEKIAAATGSKKAQVMAALQLVQDRIRYVYVGLDGGNYTPAGIDETWDRRYGDCKAKTVMLMAILRELGIEAEAVLVNTQGGDGTNERLPAPSAFDHVLVRANIDGKNYWLDGTRTGDKLITLLPSPSSRWALPLSMNGSELESVAAELPKLPQTIDVVEIDASKGAEHKADVTTRRILRNNEAIQLRAALSGLSAEDASSQLQSLWRGGWIVPEAASWRYDEATIALEITVRGKSRLDWTGNNEEGLDYSLPGAGFTPPSEYERPSDQDQTAPWATEYPTYWCKATSIRLPPATDDWEWDYFSAPVSNQIGGVSYWRVSDMRDGVVRTIMSKRVVKPEIDAAEAENLGKGLRSFDKYISRVLQVAPGDGKIHPRNAPKPPFDAATDWTNIDAPCGDPAVTP